MSNLPNETVADRTLVSRDLAQQIRGVAIRVKASGVMLSLDAPLRHHDLIKRVHDWIGCPITHDEFEQGFISATGKFLTRERAAVLCGRNGARLYSEDLW